MILIEKGGWRGWGRKNKNMILIAYSVIEMDIMLMHLRSHGTRLDRKGMTRKENHYVVAHWNIVVTRDLFSIFSHNFGY